MTLHQLRTHPEYVEGCYGCKIATVGLWACTPSRSQGAGKGDRTAQKKWDAELDLYSAARKQGVQPASTKTRDIRKALDTSDKFNMAYDASDPTPILNAAAASA